MKAKKTVAAIVAFILVLLINCCVARYQPGVEDKRITFEVTIKSNQAVTPTIFYLTSSQNIDMGFSEEQAVHGEYSTVGKKETIEFSVPATISYVRFDPCENGEEVQIYEIRMLYKENEISNQDFSVMSARTLVEPEVMDETDGVLNIRAGSDDPSLTWAVDTDSIQNFVKDAVAPQTIAVKVLLCIVIDVLFIVAWKKRKVILEIPKEIIQNRKLIFSLAKNDFKTKFAGSYFGIIWAFVQPIVTVIVYWFVFEKALSAGAQTTREGITVPYVLWLIAGLVPWFFFSEVLSMGTNVLIEYSYLVKKVVFKISILPVVKIVSSLFIHLFFIAFTLILYCCYQYFPTLYTLQIIYYSFCMIMLCLGIVYATSAVVIFFRDLSQVINIVLQVGMWATPIMWNIDSMEGKTSPIILGILKLNPMYYVVSGYRDALINHVWFWNRPEITVYFWLFVIIVFGIGFTIFRRLQVHFADVL